MNYYLIIIVHSLQHLNYFYLSKYKKIKTYSKIYFLDKHTNHLFHILSKNLVQFFFYQSFTILFIYFIFKDSHILPRLFYIIVNLIYISKFK